MVVLRNEPIFLTGLTGSFAKRAGKKKGSTREPFFAGLVPRRGLEPPRAFAHKYLKLARLPIPPPRQGVRDGAIACVLGRAAILVRQPGLVKGTLAPIQHEKLQRYSEWPDAANPPPPASLILTASARHVNTPIPSPAASSSSRP